LSQAVQYSFLSTTFRGASGKSLFLSKTDFSRMFLQSPRFFLPYTPEFVFNFLFLAKELAAGKLLMMSSYALSAS
jgi:hypothetical protein